MQSDKKNSSVPAAAWGLLTLASLYTLKAAADYLIPLFIAVFLHFILRPVYRKLVLMRVPGSLAAFLLLALVVLAAGFGFIKLKDPALEILRVIPESLQNLQTHVDEIRRGNTIDRTLEEVQKITENTADQQTPEVHVQEKTVGEMLLEITIQTLVSAMMVFALLFFLLISWDPLVAKINSFSKTKKGGEDNAAAAIIHETEAVVSAYFFNFTLINIGLGLCIGTAMFFLGMPNPALWGVMGGLMNFIPYVGAFLTLGTISIVAFLEFPFQHAVLIPITYWTITNLESLFITPLILGRNLTIHPLFIFLSLSFWGWLWGIAGLFIAVPALMTFRIICQHTPGLSPAGKFLEA